MEPDLRAHLEEFRRNRHHLSAWGESIRQFFLAHPELASGDFPVIHSIRFRVKNEHHLEDKLRRKFRDRGDFPAPDLLDQITDLVGVRLLHLHQDQFAQIHKAVNDQVSRGDWALREEVIAYTWDPECTKFFESLGIKTELKESHYTSIHYVLKPRQDSHLACELQVRTLFEEAWGEIDHSINYPTDCEIESCKEQIRVLAKLVGASTRLADSIFRTHKRDR